MSSETVKIEVDGAGVGSLLVGDVDMSRVATGVSVDIDPGQGTTVVVHMRVGLLAGDLVDPEVQVDAVTHEALRALGWTPPGAEVVLGTVEEFTETVEMDESQFVLTWHPLDPDAEPVEVPLAEHWVLPHRVADGDDLLDVVGEFRLSTREVPEVSGG